MEITIGSDVVINKRSKEHATATLSFNDILRKFIIEGLNINPSDLAKVLRKSRFTLEIEN
ncbi:hypothetical protein HYU13_06370 [Candidatus Woesearchaeota archaeon]|nr:hypothetical protein [Candidatus Woesearchaeota archaeon]